MHNPKDSPLNYLSISVHYSNKDKIKEQIVIQMGKDILYSVRPPIKKSTNCELNKRFRTAVKTLSL